MLWRRDLGSLKSRKRRTDHPNTHTEKAKLILLENTRLHATWNFEGIYSKMYYS